MNGAGPNLQAPRDYTTLRTSLLYGGATLLLVLAAFFALNYFNVVSLSEVFPSAFGWLPHRNTQPLSSTQNKIVKRPVEKTAGFSFNERLLAKASLPTGWQVVADCAGIYYIDQGGNRSCETARANQTPVEVHIGDEAEIYKKVVEMYNRSPEKTKTIDNKKAVFYKTHPANEPNTFYVTYIILDNNVFLNIRSKDETQQDIYSSIVNSLKFY